MRGSLENQRQSYRARLRKDRRKSSPGHPCTEPHLVSFRSLPKDKAAACVFSSHVSFQLRVRCWERDPGDPVCPGQDNHLAWQLPQASPGYKSNFPSRKLRVLARKEESGYWSSKQGLNFCQSSM